jgi:hypothetical protein
VNKTMFDKALSLVRAANFAVIASEYSVNSFGSWYVTVDTQPKRRLVWDGKEGWYVVEEQQPNESSITKEWKDLWMERSPRAESLAIGVRKLCANE